MLCDCVCVLCVVPDGGLGGFQHLGSGVGAWEGLGRGPKVHTARLVAPEAPRHDHLTQGGRGSGGRQVSDGRKERERRSSLKRQQLTFTALATKGTARTHRRLIHELALALVDGPQDARQGRVVVRAVRLVAHQPRRQLLEGRLQLDSGWWVVRGAWEEVMSSVTSRMARRPYALLVVVGSLREASTSMVCLGGHVRNR